MDAECHTEISDVDVPEDASVSCKKYSSLNVGSISTETSVVTEKCMVVTPLDWEEEKDDVTIKVQMEICTSVTPKDLEVESKYGHLFKSLNKCDVRSPGAITVNPFKVEGAICSIGRAIRMRKHWNSICVLS